MFSLLKNIFKDVWNLYLHFLHWVLSKATITISSFVIALVSIIPNVLILAGYLSFSNIAWKEVLNVYLTGQSSLTAINSISTSIMDFSFGIFLILFTVFVFFINLGYWKTLYFNTCLSYAKGKSLNVTKNEYFNWKLIWKHFQLRSLYSLLLVVPAIVSGIIITALVLYFWANELSADIEVNAYNAVSIAIWGLGIISVVLFLLIRYRLLFSFVLLAEKKDTKVSAFSYIKESFWITWGLKKLCKFIVVMLVFLTLSIPFNMVGESFKINATKIQDYVAYVNSEKEVQDIYLQNKPYYIQELVLKFDGTSQEELLQQYKNLQLMQIIYLVFSFVIILGVFERVWLSFYLRELKKPQTLGEKAKEVILDLTEKKN